MKHKLIVMVQIETDDPRLAPSADMVATAERAKEVRQAVIDNLPRLTRLIAVLPEEHARLLMMLHEAHGKELAKHTGTSGAFVRPPADYKPPT
jgi:hypothetical protein